MLQSSDRKPSSNYRIVSRLNLAKISRQRFRDLPLSVKLSLGYGLAISVTILGTITGFGIANRQVHKALSIYEEAVEDIENISSLKSALINLNYHKEAIINALEDSKTLRNDQIKSDLASFFEDSRRLEESWQVIATSDEFQADETTEGVTAEEAELAEVVLEEFEANIDEYLIQVNNLRQLIDPLFLRPENLPQLQQGLQQLDRTDFISELESFINTVAELSQAARVESEEGEKILDSAIRLQLIISLGSILASGLIGFLIVYLVSRLVLTPIRDVTEVAQQSIQEQNFNLRVPIKSQDEVGLLAATFNSYMIFAKKVLADSEETNQELQNTLKELSNTQNQMIQNEKMSSLGQLVAGVAHEINNPVNFIHGNLHHVEHYINDIFGLVKLYQAHYPNPIDEITEESENIELDFMLEDLPKVLGSMKIGTDRIRSIVLSLRNFSRLDEAEVKAVDLHEGLDSALVILNHRLKAHFDRPEIKMIKDYGKLPLVECFAGPINQVFMNLLSNSIDALEDKLLQLTPEERVGFSPQITLTTSLVDRSCPMTAAAADRSWVRIAIADNGLGIPADVQKNIFEPFFTTKQIGKGTGMGLSISYQIISEKHSGTLECFSSPGQGTEFIILLPLQLKSALTYTSSAK